MKRPIIKAVSVLGEGGVIAYPTEAVFGLGCNPFDRQAFHRIFTVKQRPLQRQCILIASSLEQIEPIIAPLSSLPFYPEILASWPGPTTWILPAAPDVPDWLAGKRRTLAIRVTRHPIAAALCTLFDGPIVSTSANHHGKPPIRSLIKLRYQFHQHVDFIVPGPLGHAKNPSRIRDAISGAYLR
jgi:L-threonylcarbamoyladenylate synthase